MNRWRGVQSLVHDLVDATTVLVSEGHDSAARNVRRVTDRIAPIAAPVRVVDDVRAVSLEATLVAVRGVNRLVELASGAAWGLAAEPPLPAELPLRSDAPGTAAWAADALIGAVNGFAGDHLHAAGNPLALGMRLRAEPSDARRVVVLIHGVSTTEWSWSMRSLDDDPASNFGTALARDAGFAPVYARYNTGRPIRVNGELLADALDDLVATWPVPLDEIVLVGHSMGGLVARSACEHGGAFLPRVRHVVTLGTPHSGAPLARFADLAERALGAVDLPAPRILSEIVKARSDGLRDLEHGEETRELPGIRYTCLAGTIAPDAEGVFGRLLGDGMVSSASAAGPSEGQRARFGGVAHHQIQCDPRVYAHLLAILGPDAPSA